MKPTIVGKILPSGGLHMINYPRNVPMTDDLMEIVQDKETDFPYKAMGSRLELYPECQTPWHWHDYFEVGIVFEGEIEISTREGKARLCTGEGFFLNANVLHKISIAKHSEHGSVYAQLFGSEMICASGSLKRHYVTAIENCVALEIIYLKPENERHKAILDALQAALSAADREEKGYELFVGAYLTQAWGGIFGLAEPMIRQDEDVHHENVVRAKAMLSYINDNYDKAITVREIAAAAGICERECFRCFNEVLKTTPMLCLNRRRVSIAAGALAEGDAPIDEIAENCGFTNSSYFGKVFRKIMDCTPAEYRRKNRRTAQKQA